MMDKKTLSDFGSSPILSSEQSSLSRLKTHSDKHDTGTISAFRDGNKLKRNLALNKKLKLELESAGLGVTAIKGVGQEEGKAVEEWSYFVADIKNQGNLKDILVNLGVKYEQDSITFAKAGKNPYYLISTNTLPQGTGGGKIGVEIKLGRPNFGKAGEFFSKIRGRPFLFSLGSGELSIVDNVNAQQAKRVWGQSSIEKIEKSFFAELSASIASTEELPQDSLNKLLKTGGL